MIYDQDQNVVGCGAIREYALGMMEIKRMFVDPSARKKGIAKLIINELEMWAKDLGASKCILETGNKMKDAISLYQRCGYHQIPNYQPYEDFINNVCFEKTIG